MEKEEKKDKKIEDIYDGEYLNIWRDEDIVSMHFLINNTLVSFPREYWIAIKKEIIEIGEL